MSGNAWQKVQTGGHICVTPCCFAALLKWPHDKVAVVDEVCMVNEAKWGKSRTGWQPNTYWKISACHQCTWHICMIQKKVAVLGLRNVLFPADSPTQSPRRKARRVVPYHQQVHQGGLLCLAGLRRPQPLCGRAEQVHVQCQTYKKHVWCRSRSSMSRSGQCASTTTADRWCGGTACGGNSQQCLGGFSSQAWETQNGQRYPA